MLGLVERCTQLVAVYTVLAALHHIMVRAERDSKRIKSDTYIGFYN